MDIEEGLLDSISQMLLIKKYDDIIQIDKLKELIQYINNHGFTYGWKSHNKIDYGHWNLSFEKVGKDNREDIEDKIPTVVINIISALRGKVIPEDSVVIRCYINAYTFGTEGYTHTDSENDSDMTIVVYLNENWKTEWFGETMFFDDKDEILTAVIPKFGRCVVFPSAMMHVGRSVSRLCPAARMVFVIKVRIE
jgi:SM-20-related protein